MKRGFYLSHPHSKGLFIVGCFQRCENLFIVCARQIDFVQCGNTGITKTLEKEGSLGIFLLKLLFYRERNGCEESRRELLKAIA